MMSFLQRLGKSLMLPVACLPVAGILIGIGYWISSYFPDSSAASFLQISGLAIIDFIPLLFAVGIAVGMSDDRNGTAALAGLVAWLVITQLLKPDSICRLSGQEADLAFTKIENVFTSIVAGCIGAFSYNHFRDTRLPEYISFFSGKRCVAIIAAAIACLAALVLMFVWPLLFHLLTSLGTGILSLGAFGAGLYVFFNRLLIPMGLHHALNQVFWFDFAGINDLARFWDGTGELGVTGQYMSGYFPIMMFALPAVALAFYHTASKEKRQKVKGLLIVAALSSCLTGVTEPMEFSFMFVAPGLYLIYALLCGLTAGVVAALPIRAGLNFSAGLVDFLLSFKAPMALHPEKLILVGLMAAVVFYFVFRWIILRFDLKTPGRETEDNSVLDTGSPMDGQVLETAPEGVDAVPEKRGNGFSSYKGRDDGDSRQAKEKAGRKSLFQAKAGKSQKESGQTEDRYQRLAGELLSALGGKDNISSLDHCVTRLRLEVLSDEAVDVNRIRQSGVKGLIRPASHSLQIVIGPDVQFVCDEIQKMMKA